MSIISTVSGNPLSRFGLGSWALGGSYGVNRSRYEVLQAIDLGLKHGLNVIDTAQGYGAGASEISLSRLIGMHERESVFVISKFGIHYPDSEKPLSRDNASSRCRVSLDQTLWNLKTDYVDAYLIHWPDWTTPVEDVARGLAEARDSGKARFVGVSNFTLRQLEALHQHVKIDVIQYPYNLVDRRIDALGIVAWARRNNVMVTSYGSLGFGSLLPVSDTKRMPGDWRHERPNHFGIGLFLPEKLERLRQCNLTLSTLKGWLAAQTSSDVPLIGFQRPLEVHEFMNARAVPVDAAALDAILANYGLDPAPQSWIDELTQYLLPET